MWHGPDDVPAVTPRAGSTPAGWPDRSRRDSAIGVPAVANVQLEGDPDRLPGCYASFSLINRALTFSVETESPANARTAGDIARQAISQQPAKSVV